jgi:diguanylate cyclase (GGDEF)-like protein
MAIPGELERPPVMFDVVIDMLAELGPGLPVQAVDIRAIEIGKRRRQRGCGANVGARDFAVLMLDIDHFKAVNDRFGHEAGDAVLCAMVRDGQKALRAIDMLVRWGGEEFFLLLPDTDADAAMVAAERMRAALAATEVSASGATIRFTVSIGVALPLTDNSGELLRRADLVLYAAKEAGRNRVVLAT